MCKSSTCLNLIGKLNKFSFFLGSSAFVHGHQPVKPVSFDTPPVNNLVAVTSSSSDKTPQMTSHQSSQLTSHQSSQLTSHQSQQLASLQTSQLASHQTSQITSQLTSHQSAHLTSHQTSQLASLKMQCLVKEESASSTNFEMHVKHEDDGTNR
jgi:hypothetical protein